MPEFAKRKVLVLYLNLEKIKRKIEQRTIEKGKLG